MNLKMLLSRSAVIAGVYFVHSSSLFAQTLQSVKLAWNPSSGPGVASYLLHYGTTSGSYTLATNAGLSTNVTVTGLQSGPTYYFAVTAVGSNGMESLPSNEVSYQGNGSPPPGQTNTLSPPWQTRDIGSPLAGSVVESNGVFTISGAGNLSGTTDNFRFLYQSLSGDGEIKARLVSESQTGVSARSGVMIRETLTTGSRNVFMGVAPNGTFYWQRRNNTSGGTSSSSSGSATPPNTWVRLVRAGNTLTGYKSIDGTNWTAVSSRKISMAANIYFGLAVASGSTNTLNTAIVRNVTAVP